MTSAQAGPSMAPRAVAALLFVLALSGCLGNRAAPAAATADADAGGVSATGPPIVVSTPPTDPIPTLSHAERERGVVYDYWGGQTSRVLFEGNFTFRTDTLFAHAENGNPLAEYGQWYSCEEDSGGCKLVHFPAGAIVAPGTAALVMTGGWTGSPFGGVELHVMDPTATVSYHRFNATGTRIQIPINDSLADPPNAAVSHWKVAALGGDQDGTPVMVGIAPLQVHLRIEIERRPGPLPISHGFADAWDATSTRRVANATGSFSLGPDSTHRPEDWSNVWPRDKASIVPWGTKEVDMWFHYNSSLSTNTGWTPLLTWTSGDRNLYEYEGVDAPPTVAHAVENSGYFLWRLPTEPRMWDPPTLNHTAWSFLLNVDGWPSTLQVSRVDFHVVITATNVK